MLRSLGKFFGLAGARVGFVLSSSTLLSDLADWLGPWSVAGPSRCDRKGRANGPRLAGDHPKAPA